MSPSLKSLDSKTKCIRLVQSCIVISLRRCGSDKFIKASDNDIAVNDLVNVRSHSWPDSTSGRPISPATLSYNSNDAAITSSYNPLSSTSSYVRCTCNQIDGWTLFNQFISENSTSVWNPYIVGCLGQLQFKGFLYPVNLLIGGTEFALEVMRSAWARRVLKAPQGFEIEFIGDISYIESSVVNQTQFTPLAEALCKSIAELNIRQISASFDAIVKRLEVDFPNMELPSEKVLRNSLKTLCHERKLYYFKEKDCYIASFYGYKNDYLIEDMRSTFSPNNHHLMTSEDAFTRLHGKTSLVCDESSASYRSSDAKHNSGNNSNNSHKKADSYGSPPNHSTMTSKTENNLDNNSVTQINASLRRSASLRIEAHKTNNSDENKAFNRSKSFKMNRENHQLFAEQQTDLKERCTCKIEPYKKQSMLSKFLRIGNVNSAAKTKAYISKNANFSSQFPEINGKLIADSDIMKSIAAVETKSKATQTIKCGPEDANIAALIVKQAKKHAFAKSRQQNNNNDYDCKNKALVCCCVQDYLNSELNHGKSVQYGMQRSSKRANESRFGTSHELPVTPQEDCLLCNTETNNKVNLNGHENVHNNNNYNKDRAAYKQSRNNSNGSYKFHNALKDNKQISFYNHNNDNSNSVTSPIYIQTHAFSDQCKDIANNGITNNGITNNGIAIKSERMPEQQEILFLNNNNSSNNNNNNNSSNNVERPKDKTQHLINATLNTKYLKDCQLRFTQNHSSAPLQEKHALSDNANNLTLDNSFNVKIEIGSSPATNNIIANINSKHDKRVVRQNSSEKNISFITSNPVITTQDNQMNHTESSPKKSQIVTSATTVTTTMTIPNIYNNDNYQIKTNDQQLYESNEDNDLVVKCVKLCKEDNTSKMSNNKQNNLYNEYRNNSVPHLSPIRQKVAKAKAEFFNSSQPQSPQTLVSNNNILIKKIKQ